MSRLQRATTTFYLQSFRNGSWLLNIYLIKSDKQEMISDNQVTQIIELYLNKLETSCLSEEFLYYRTGFAFLHYGTRGVDLTIWHYGKWGSTLETYCCSWYCYGRDISKMELLDSAEPVICQYEMLYIIEEISALCQILDNDASCDFRNEFRDYYLKLQIAKNNEHPPALAILY